MSKSSCRITEISIKNFKNVKNGSVRLYPGYDKFYPASILGLYGQNGSGKTALIDGLALLKYALTGKPIPFIWAGLINKGSEESRFHFRFTIQNAYEKYRLDYAFSLCREKREPLGNMDFLDYEDEEGWNYEQGRQRAVIKKESLSLAYDGIPEKEEKAPLFSAEAESFPPAFFKEEKFPDEEIKHLRKEKLIDTDTPGVFLPLTKYKLLVGTSKSTKEKLYMEKLLCQRESRSFLFSKELYRAIEKQAESMKNKKEGQALSIYLRAIRSLILYGNLGLFVFNYKNSNALFLIQPLAKMKTNGTEKGKSIQLSSGPLRIPFDGPGLVPNRFLEGMDMALDRMNLVLPTLIPGMTLQYEKLGSQMLRDGQMGTNIQLMAHRDEITIPLEYESQGNRKIISILQLLIMIFNEPSVTVAVDELDSGIFEYLLGELLHIISRQGYGQLIFTSHNLRPLEILDPRFIAFSTTNPSNCYIRFRSPGDSKNLRDFYYRNILLGGQREELYRATYNPEIALALRAAGRPLEEEEDSFDEDLDGEEQQNET